jgi:hypothetical protein
MVAAHFDRAMFSCQACERAEKSGGDLRSQNSGSARSCDGPREWTFFRGHHTGGFTWRGCPRASLTAQVDAWLAVYDRCDGKLSYTEQRRASWLLLDVFQALDYVRALQAWEARERASSSAASTMNAGRQR